MFTIEDYISYYIKMSTFPRKIYEYFKHFYVFQYLIL